MKRTIATIITLTCLLGCTAGEGSVFKTPLQTDQGLLAPGKLFTRGLPRGNDSYSQGVRDGCQTFMSIVGAGTLRMLPEVLDGYRLTEDSAYTRGFLDGGSFCTFSLDWDTH